MAEENTIVFNSTIDYIDKSKFWKGKRYKYPLPKRTEIARNQGVQKLILDSKDPVLKRAISEITKELIERLEIKINETD